MKLTFKFSFWWLPAALGALIALLGMALALRREPAAVPPAVKLANVEILTLRASTYHEVLELPARIVADRSVVLSAESGGRLESWEVEEGATVAAGTVLATIDDDELRAQLEEAKARHRAARAMIDVAERQSEVARATAMQARTALDSARSRQDAAGSDLGFRRREYNRIKELTDAGIATPAELDAALNDLNQAQSGADSAVHGVAAAEQAVVSAEADSLRARTAIELAQSQAAEAEKNVELAQLRLDKTQIKASFAGTVDHYLVEIGGLVAPGTPLIKLYDTAHVRAVVNVSDRYVPFLETGNAAIGHYLRETIPNASQDVAAAVILPSMPRLAGGAEPGLELAAAIARVGQASDPLSNTFEVELRIPNPGMALREGVIVTSRLRFLTYSDALVVPLRSLAVSDSGTRVLVAVSRDGKDYAGIRRVIPLSIRSDAVLVAGDLAPGDRVIVAGGKGVVDGERITVLVADGEIAAAAKADRN